MDQKVKELINDGKYSKAESIARIHLNDYDLGEAKEIYNELYDRAAERF